MTPPWSHCRDVPADLAAFIRARQFPCVGAKGSLAAGRLYALEAGDIGEASHDVVIRAALAAYAGLAASDELSSFACMFRAANPPMGEVAFEAALWGRLQALHDLDAAEQVGWAEEASDDPRSAHFCMSVGGTAFFVVGLHPGASRLSRRFARPTMIFNAHRQFERLKADGRYQSMQRTNRARDIQLQGDINPMLADFGERSEAAQYSGRQVDASWRCPFKVKT